MVNQQLTDLRGIAIGKEDGFFNPKASFSKDHSRYEKIEEDYRLPYKRDVDRIIYSKSYSRYIDKTQVVYLVENDHVTSRGLHVQLVSNFARGIAEILKLNCDLVEAIALGHDVGHSPFGHEGEGYLSELSEAHGNGVFAHPWQSCRLLYTLEPLNLGLAVYDGILCHDGGLRSDKFVPRYGKTWDDHFNDLKQKLTDPNFDIMPGTLEGCLVKFSDKMAYIGRDIEDAIQLGIISREQVPETILGKSNRKMLTVMAEDLIRNSYEKDYIAISPEIREALIKLRSFNFEHIYVHKKLKVESKKIRRSFRVLFEMLLEDLKKNKRSSYIWKDFLSNKPETYLSKTSPVQMIVDYISGMTDNFFVRTLEKLVIPKRIEIF
jgi:dGTPase